MTGAVALKVVQDVREVRDRLELLTATIEGPGFDPLFRPDIIDVPRDHPALHWNCLVTDCLGQIRAKELCRRHVEQWLEQEALGVDRLEYLRSARPFEDGNSWRLAPRRCLVNQCQRPARRGVSMALCTWHIGQWKVGNGDSIRVEDPARFAAWVARQPPAASFGECAAACCVELARSPLGLCEFHEMGYRGAGRPGTASLPLNWGRWYDHLNGSPAPIEFEDRVAFQRWCHSTPPAPRPGRLSTFGLHPLVKAELKWSLFAYTQRSDHTRWWIHSLQRVLACCEGLRSLQAFDLEGCGDHERMIVKEMLRGLQAVYMTPSDTREAGYIDLEHFGRKVNYLTTKFELKGLSQRWLRDLFWDYMAMQMRLVNCPRGRNWYYNVRLAGQELSVFVETFAPAGGHDPSVLGEAIVEQFVADQRRRARDRLPSMRTGDGNKPPIVTEVTCTNTFDLLRKIFRWALETGKTEPLALDRGFIWALPPGGRKPHRIRSPFSDPTAAALADPDNLTKLESLDITDRGLRDIWETITATGRRAGEIVALRLDCITIHNGIPRLWHDQTKVGNLDEAIRIPEYVHTRLNERRAKTLNSFEHRYGRAPDAEERAKMAMFPRRSRNPHGRHNVAYTWFGDHFRTWVDDLDLGTAVPHQARHTLATKLLAAGASMQHIKRFLGHVSERMTEHYAKVALSEIDEVLHHVWVAGPGSHNPGEMLSRGVTPLPREQAQALVLDLNRRSTPTDGGICTYQIVVDGGACPWKLDCENCEKFVMTGADLLYWRRKREQ